eukprot:5068944-Heterocapsa_arctica.AAC.1
MQPLSTCATGAHCHPLVLQQCPEDGEAAVFTGPACAGQVQGRADVAGEVCHAAGQSVHEPRAVLWLGPKAEEEVALFLEDAEFFDASQAQVRAGASELRDLYERSISHLRPAQQLLLALRQQRGQLSQDLKAFLEKKFTRQMQSQVAEDGFNICRRHETQNKVAP